MSKTKYLPPQQLSAKHLGKPTKLLLKNGKVLYGTIKEIRSNGIIFIPASEVRSKLFVPFIFFPFGFFVGFVIF
ncbi:hypothetical protein [Lihuaxuella thermophila]|uniref:Uncharacterized protein n=1 Tax=Lihuaxuella thermophila TaxID=1173111 RepID=A0A1H8CNT0_9BACL|nr:hypothetical protein [Lihuaxuella thermophila]SEM96793.1 hypothetical protein SAMN05444955_10435 [Lihuaxuella thermophila]